jgi:hypothetical protein
MIRRGATAVNASRECLEKGGFLNSPETIRRRAGLRRSQYLIIRLGIKILLLASRLKF